MAETTMLGTQEAASGDAGSQKKEDAAQRRAPEEPDVSRDDTGTSESTSTMKRKYSDREPESPGQQQHAAAFAPEQPEKKRAAYYETSETDSPSSYPKHVLVPTTEKTEEETYPISANVTQSPADQPSDQPAQSGGQGTLLTPDSFGRARASQSYDSQPLNYRQPPYHEVYRTPSYGEMEYGRGSYGPPPQHHPPPPPPPPQQSRRWACDVCNVATFLSYEEACAHEEVCSRRYQEQQQYHDPRQPPRQPPMQGYGHRGSMPTQASGLGALYQAGQEVVTPPTPHRHASTNRWSSQPGPPLPVFHEHGYYRQGPYDGREEPSQQYYDPHGYHPPPPQHPPHHHQYPPSQHHPHHPPQDYYQKRMLLAMASDRDSLSDRQCYVRSEMVEIFAATDKDVSARHSKGAQKLVIGQVGIRCVHCSHLRPRDRAERAVCYPSSISRIYQTVADMQRFHFEQCREIPEHVRQIYKKLKTTRPRGVGSPQTYWMSSAKQLGLIDTEQGIRFDTDVAKDQISEMTIGPQG